MGKVNSVSRSLEQKIREDIEKTGYPTEIVSASIMQGRGWEVTHNPSYWDEDERKSREFDILAFRDIESRNIHLGINLIFACKKSEKPWVFFMTKENRSDSYLIDVLKANNRIDSIEAFYQKLSSSSHHYLNKQFLARTFYEPSKKQERSTMIYSAVLSSIKATMYIKKNYNSDKLYLFVFYPVIIFNGNLFEAYISGDKSPEIKKSNHIQISFNYIPQNTSTGSYYEKPDRFIIDVIQFITGHFLTSK
jgi:hypothetical protein